MKTDFFITYHHGDELAARWIAGVLKDVPFSLFMESWDFLPGQRPVEKIVHMTAIAPCALVLVSDRFLQAGVDAESWQTVMERFDTNAVILLRIDSCSVETALSVVPYTDLFGIKEAEARKRVLTAVGTPTPDKKETEGLRVTATTREEVLEKRKAELEELLTTTIKHNYHMKLDLEQEVEKEVEVEDERTGEKVKRKQWVWEAVALETVLKDGNNYILVNPSGMGKSTFLTHVARVLLDGDGDYPFLPLFFTCIALNNRDGSITNFINNRVEWFYNNSRTAMVQDEWENLCVLLDALDQARDVNDIASSLHILDRYGYYKKAKIILSSRENTAGKVKAGFRKIRLKLPVANEVRHYLGEENYKQLEGHIATSGELVKVPVLLEMLKTISEKGYDASKLWNRADLYTEFTKILVDQERNKPRFWQDPLSIRHFLDNELEQALEKIAFFSLVDNNILEIEKEKLVQYCETLEKKEALLNIGIILELFEDMEQKIVFRHQSFQAYFAARYMYFRRPELFETLTDNVGFFYNDVWYEVMRFFVGLEKEPQKAGYIIELLSKQRLPGMNLNDALRLIFAVFLFSEARVSKKEIKNLHEQLRLLLTSTRGYWNFFFTNIDKFNPENDEQRRNLFITLLSLPRDEDELDRNNTAKSLWKILTPSDIPFLEPLLRSGDEFVRYVAAEVLGNIGTINHIHLLEPLSNDAVNWVRNAAFEAAGKIVAPYDILSLEQRFMDKHKWVLDAYFQKASGGVVTAENILFQQTQPMGKGVKSLVAEAVREIIKNNEFDDKLKILIKNKDKDAHRTIIEVLGELETVSDNLILKTMLMDGDKDVRSTAAEVFGNFGTANDIPLLEPLLEDKNEDVRVVAAQALGKICTTGHINLLKPLLMDKNDLVRLAATQVLRKIGKAKDTSLLEPLLNDRNDLIRRTVAEAVGKIGTVKDISLLETLLKERQIAVRNVAAEAIEQIYKRSTSELYIPLLTTKKGLKRKVSLQFFTPPPVHPLHILHLSDIHYAAENDPSITHIFHEFLRDIQQWRKQQNKQNIRVICITGDIAQSGQKNQYRSIQKKINSILKTTGCSKANLFIIPGNHDVRGYDQISPQGLITLEQVWKNKKSIDSHVLVEFENYREFHEKFSHYHGFVENSGYVNSLTKKCKGNPKPWYSRKLKDFPVRIIGLNSALFCLKDYSQRNKVRMGTCQFHEAYFQGKPGDTGDRGPVILLTHHPIDWLEETEKNELKTLIDRYSVIHLHGHVHRLSIDEIRSYSGSTYMLIGTGSIYGEEGTKDINTYHIMTLDFEKEEIQIWGRRWVPEFSMWTTFMDNSRDTFSFPGKHGSKINGAHGTHTNRENTEK